MAFDLSSYLVPLNPLEKQTVCDEDAEDNDEDGYCNRWCNGQTDPLVTELNRLSLQKQTVYHRRNGVVDPPPPYALDRSHRESNALATDPLYSIPNDPRRSSYLRNLDLSFIEAETSIWRKSAKLTRSVSAEATPMVRGGSFEFWRPCSPPPSFPHAPRSSLSDGCLSLSESQDCSRYSSPPCSSPVSPDDLSDSETSSCTERRRKKGPRKRKVSFPDDFGLPLTTVRLVEEYVPAPIMWSGGRGPSHRADYNSRRELILGFSQPVFDLNGFLHKVNTNFVSLENIRTEGDEFLGTIRVKNVSFAKDVFVRYTINNWVSSRDVMTSFVAHHDQKQTHVPYDTFSFRISVASSTSGVEFAICYRVGGAEHWDNNDGINYHLYCVTKEATYIGDDDQVMDYNNNNNHDDEDDAFYDFDSTDEFEF